jgi:hypothetical protein
VNPLALIGWWREIAMLLLVAALGIQSYKLLGAQGELAVHEERIEAEKRYQAAVALQNLKNKERTDEEYSTALRRARALSLRVEPAPAIQPGTLTPPASGDDAAFCLDRERAAEELTGFVERHAGRLSALIAAVSRRHAERLAGNAVAGEEVAAAYRACRAFAVGLPSADRPKVEDRPSAGS